MIHSYCTQSDAFVDDDIVMFDTFSRVLQTLTPSQNERKQKWLGQSESWAKSSDFPPGLVEIRIPLNG
ncbi:hypothetical protein [Thiomicrospira sp. S5]|uniref:hypothetical protein n=1 Tax=Thiomicrospira sp. S5 TaxID=1803865 RepID=UPI000F8A190C|nr:hypothetical protein [Thiomicrospira sp. S5]AZR81294.1 hypothetical protein AYJ59_02715 [Thiomicrospira sp. S5]AZR81463.1 hypothetical protein AYJ59_03685 [Thiomicrospira sp. S5]